MALLQISEPGESPAPHARKRACGIDLGTTNSLVATVRHGLAVVLPDEEGRCGHQPTQDRFARRIRDRCELGTALDPVDLAFHLAPPCTLSGR